MTAAIQDAKHPTHAVEQSARREFDALVQAGKDVNRIVNGDFANGPFKPKPDTAPNRATDGVPAPWKFCADASSGNARCDWDRDAKVFRVWHTHNGAVLQELPVKPGERYYATARTRSKGNGLPSFSFGWKTADGTSVWDNRYKLVIAPLREAKSEDDWSDWGALVIVPDGVERIVVLLGVEGQFSDSDVIWWDDVRLVRLP